MEHRRTICAQTLLLIIGGLTQCMAVKHITAMKGQMLTLTCPLRNFHKSEHVEWRNPDGFLMFFNKHRALKDMRNEVSVLTKSKYSIRISDITFKDGGVYKCLHYGNQVITKRYRVVVLSGPVLEKTEHEDKTIIKCSASGNGQLPTISWLLESGLEIDAYPNYILENSSNKYTAVSHLSVKSHKRRVTVKCLVHHPALHGATLIDFVHIGDQDADEKTSLAPEYISTTTEKVVTPTLVPQFSSTTFSGSSYSGSETTDVQQTDVNSTSYNSTNANDTTEFIFETTEGTSLNITTDSPNSTSGAENVNESSREKIQNKKGNSALLVMLVTCLIFALIVVLAFFLLRLRKAHLAWKQENEENDQSVESSKSKSSNEEKQRQNQQQRGRGLWNTSFTKYKVEEVVESGATITPAPLVVPDVKPYNSNNTVLKSCIRETEL
ncbi:hypothetical protein NFI96_031272 [Prochilodus magdalenae]|nr:hypothetical protein NFI96_031272 [Prochilodus magdalenae]